MPVQTVNPFQIGTQAQRVLTNALKTPEADKSWATGSLDAYSRSLKGWTGAGARTLAAVPQAIGEAFAHRVEGTSAATEVSAQGLANPSRQVLTNGIGLIGKGAGGLIGGSLGLLTALPAGLCGANHSDWISSAANEFAEVGEWVGKHATSLVCTTALEVGRLAHTVITGTAAAVGAVLGATFGLVASLAATRNWEEPASRLARANESLTRAQEALEAKRQTLETARTDFAEANGRLEKTENGLATTREAHKKGLKALGYMRLEAEGAACKSDYKDALVKVVESSEGSFSVEGGSEGAQQEFAAAREDQERANQSVTTAQTRVDELAARITNLKTELGQAKGAKKQTSRVAVRQEAQFNRLDKAVRQAQKEQQAAEAAQQAHTARLAKEAEAQASDQPALTDEILTA